MSDPIMNVLFLCTGNSARSILAEVALSRVGEGRFRAFSAGSQPRGEVNPDAILLLQRLGYPIAGLRSKSWDEFAVPDAPQMDFIFTVCDSAAGEACPFWPGHPASAHWGIEDPSHVQGGEEERLQAFETALHFLEERLSLFVALPFDRLDKAALKSRLQEIGEIEGASDGAKVTRA